MKRNLRDFTETGNYAAGGKIRQSFPYACCLRSGMRIKMAEKKCGKKNIIKGIGMGIVTAAWAVSILLLALLYMQGFGLQAAAAQGDRAEAGERTETEEKSGIEEMAEEKTEAGEKTVAEREPAGEKEAVRGAGGDGLEIPFAVDPGEWNYILVNQTQPLPEDFAPRLTRTRNGKLVDSRIKRPLEQMLDDAEKAGYRLVICSAYRDREKQAGLLETKTGLLERSGLERHEAFREAGRQLEMPGHSEHHTGLAVDIVGVAYQVLDEGQAGTKEAGWLAEHCAEYGFILRYPPDKEAVTGIEYESWHFRYVGKPAAAFMREKGLCLEEFLELAAVQ